MIFLVLFRKIKSFFYFIISILAKCFCCLRKKHLEDELPITIHSGKINKVGGEAEFDKWDSWDGPSSIKSDGKVLSPMEQQIHQYRINQQRKLSDPPEEPNYFEDLAPKIKKKPQVIILARPEEEQLVSNRTSISLTEPFLEVSELQDWHDEEEGWEEKADEELDLDVDAAIREQRENMRQAKKMERLKRKAEKDMTKQMQKSSGHKFAMKLS